MGSQRCPEPAIRYSGVEPLPEAGPMGQCSETKVLIAGSHAAQTCEPRQVRKEATVSKALRVPWVRLA